VGLDQWGWRPLLVAAWLAAACGGGCGGGPQLAPVTGRVTYAGKPVKEGRITFYPESGRMALGTISDGVYTLTTFRPGDGALVGSHKVAIHATRVGPSSLAAPANAEEEARLSRRGGPGVRVIVPGKVEWLVPEKYSEPATSGLTAEVKRGPNDIDFDLPAAP
jgi:hypothetical protein